MHGTVITMVSSVGPRGAWTEDMAKKEMDKKEPCVKKEGGCTDSKETDIKNEKKPRAANPWLIHVAAFRKANPQLKYKDVLLQAKDTYVKIAKKAPS
jgi:hypothetical protein